MTVLPDEIETLMLRKDGLNTSSCPGLRKCRTMVLLISAVRRLSKENVVHDLHQPHHDNQERKSKSSSDSDGGGGFMEEFRGLDVEMLARLVEEKKLSVLEERGGVVGIASDLRTDVVRGISGPPKDVSDRRNYFGENCYPRKSAQCFLKFLVEAFWDTTIITLMICAMLSLGLGIKSEGANGGWCDGASIAYAVVLVVTVTAISDYRQSVQVQKRCAETSNPRVDVCRGGRRSKVSIFELVVGDVVHLNTGDQVPADGLLVGGCSVKIDESSMSGESDRIHKDAKNDPFLMSSTKVANGFGSMLVTSVGINTQRGRSTLAQHSSPKTRLQIRPNGMTAFVGKIGLNVAFMVLLVLLTRYFSGYTFDRNGNGHTSTNEAIDGLVDIIATAVTMVVVAIPEEMHERHSLAVRLIFAYSAKKMMRDNVLVRKLSACKTMGSATTICTNTTGTLTLNQMTVSRVWVAGNLVMLPDQVNTNIPLNSIPSSLFEGIALNTTRSVYFPGVDKNEEGAVSIYFPEADKNEEGAIEVSGGPTEKAILSWALKMGMTNPIHLKANYSVLNVESFDSEKKQSGVAIKDLKTEKTRVHWKGAAEIILGMCSHSIKSDGKMLQLDQGGRENLQSVIEGMVAASLRCIAFAYKDGDEKGSERTEMSEGGLALLAIVGLKDPCRPNVGRAIECCKSAGVTVRMVTGDNMFTAKAIALECGILARDQIVGEPAVIEGEVFRNYSAEQRMNYVDKICVMARSSPSDKLLIVQTLKEKQHHVVAVTGDGKNNVPALRLADIGLATGIQETEVAEDRSNIIILDDNFSSVVTAVRWGRTVYSNIQNFTQFQKTVNVTATVINLVAAMSSEDVPLTAVQLWWVNLITDTLGALALATEPPTDKLMTVPPVARDDPLIPNLMWRNLVAQAIYQIALLLTLKFRGTTIFGFDRNTNNTMIFNSFVLCQVFNEFNARKAQEKNVFKGIEKNRLFVGIVGVTVLLQVLMVEFLKKFASTERLDWRQWAICIALASFSWPLAWWVKYVPVPKQPFRQYMKAWWVKYVPVPKQPFCQYMQECLKGEKKRMRIEDGERP